MAQTPLDRGLHSWANPIWWAEQQLKLMSATTTYLGRVAEALTPEPSAPAPAAPEPSAPAAPEPELPVPGWDELSLGSIRARLSRLSEADLVTLHAYEEGHLARPDVVSMLAHRLIKVRQAEGSAGSAD